MKYFISFCLLFLFYFELCNYAYSQDFVDNGTRTFQLIQIHCLRAKGKVVGESIRIEADIDGLELGSPIKKALKTNELWEINYSYDYLDSIQLKLWDDNVFKDILISNIIFDNRYTDKIKTITLTSKDVDFDITFKIVPGPGYKAIINKLQNSVYLLKEDLKLLKNETSSLKEEVESLEDENNRLKEKIKDLDDG
ncbi:MAG: hypothetical protein AB1782_04835 [Cyanobacteriota bacterium]